ncbi:MAG: DUF1549 and DUF1553 domain-containing protein [Pirellulaceae bacterium]
MEDDAQAGVASSGAADRETWLRRVYFDLIGLPPSVDEIAAFVGGSRPDAARRVIDNLLARPEFGERWGRHWMDVARYADTVGYTLANKPPRLEGSERYRDWLIRRFNDDLPYSDQIILQLAADTIDPDNKSGDLDAMGFLTVGRRFLSNDDTIDDRIDLVTRGLLGLTVQCARCHDHKFDPIPTMDYYSLVGVFNSSELRDKAASPLALFDKEKVGDHPVWVRGQRGNRGPIAPRRFLTALHGEEPPRFENGSGRLDLAHAIVDTSNPLTRRVLANRVWMHLMGKPFVDTPSDFGVRTQQPIQAEVLDDLAVAFAEDGDSVKRLIRRIAGSYLYSQSSQATTDAVRNDPDNWYFGRATRRRRDFESLRDTILQCAGQLDFRKGGAPVDIAESPDQSRRTIYAFIDRQQLPAIFRVFDVAGPDAHAPQRYYTTVPQQALYLMNSPFILKASVSVVDAATKALPADATNEQQVAAVFQKILKRSPSTEELRLAVQFCRSEIDPETVAIVPASAWAYGYGKLNEGQTAIDGFTPLPKFHEGRWGGGEALPDKQLGYTSLTANGGHPGQHFDTVRRWIAPRAGRLEIAYQAEHPSDKGDGVRMLIVSNGERLSEKNVQNSKVAVDKVAIDVQPGQAVDFVVNQNGSTSFDGYRQTIQLRLTPVRGLPTEFDSLADFSGSTDAGNSKLLTRLEQFAHALLVSNEFTFVD